MLRDIRWHRPLLGLAALMGLVVITGTVGVFVDDRLITGVDGWFKPIKFALSIGIYAITLSWVIGQLTRFKKAARWAGNVIVIALLIEIVIIVGAAAAGTTSHFNVSTDFNRNLYYVMAVSIGTAWIMNFVIALPLFFSQAGDKARILALRGGMIVGLVGIGVATLMTSPSAEQQLHNIEDISGAHTVGLPDGGPSLFFLGWSTVGGDLRVPHFIGMHALQALPLLVFALEYLARRRGGSLLNVTVRFRLILVVTISYALALVNMTLQALAGQSIVQPSGPYLISGLLIAVASLAASLVILQRPCVSDDRKRKPSTIDA